MEISLYKKPVYEVQYKGFYHTESFTLKTLKGCKNRIEREGLKDWEIYKLERHIADSSQDKRELIERA